MFHEATQKIVKEIDPYGSILIPASTPYHSGDFKPLHIIKKIKKWFFFTKDRYIPTSIMVANILENGQDLDLEPKITTVCGYSADSDISISGEVGVSVCDVDAGMYMKGGTSSTISAIEMKKRAISLNMLLEATRNRKINRGHSFVKQMYNDIVYIVTEVVETDRECNLSSIFKTNSGVKGTIQKLMAGVGVTAKTNQKLSCPAGTTIAFKVSKLRISTDDTLDVPDWICHCHMAEIAKLDVPLTEIIKLSKDTRLVLLNIFLENLHSSDHLPVLETMLDQISESFQPNLHVLELMEDENRACVEKLLDLMGIWTADPPGQPLTLTPDQNGIINTVAMFIQALSELNPDILNLLANSIEINDIAIQVKLFENIEERFFSFLVTNEIGNAQEAEEALETVALQLSSRGFEMTQSILKELGFQLIKENKSISCKKENANKAIFYSIFAILSILGALVN